MNGERIELNAVTNTSIYYVSFTFQENGVSYERKSPDILRVVSVILCSWSQKPLQMSVIALEEICINRKQ